ncbi:hypothetical protein D910_08346 [Dendroctonus ponderosae]|uniref:CUE domain-containing protein n=1 Tax=Dendroctonus ponderosae TaxID=77166 RepID=U4UAR6_DENPD|nr:hypothetical protein D910_08346 [Dendroctonus ponderosae]
MSIDNSLARLTIADNLPNENVFKNPSKLPINEIHMERSWRELKRNLSTGFDWEDRSEKDLEQSCFELKKEIIPALDKRWLLKLSFHKFAPVCIPQQDGENTAFLAENTLFIDSLDYLLTCDYHHFWCCILFEESATTAIRSFLLKPVLPFEANYLEGEYMEVYKTVFNKFLLVYKKLLTFKQSETEYMSQSFGLAKLKERKLINLPIVITLAVLYQDSDLEFVNETVDIYFNDATEVEYLTKEVDFFIEQNLIILEMIGGQVCGFDESVEAVPISIEKRPAIFSLSWVYSVVNYLLCSVITSQVLFTFFKPSIEIATQKNFPFRLPYIYVNIYRDLYELLDEREEAHTQENLFKMVIQEINLGRTEFIETFHLFVSNCLDEALKHTGDSDKQEPIIENYIRLLTTALEDDYFICDYNAAHNVASQNEIDSTQTDFIVSCIIKLPRNKKLQELTELKKKTIESVFKEFIPVVPEEPEEDIAQPGPSRGLTELPESEIDQKIQSIMDMFPHLGDGFVLQCLESYNFNTTDVINAILEDNLPPHLSEIPFDGIRIPAEPEPEKPVLAYTGKKPEYDDALKLLNDKTDIKAIKNLVLEGIQYNYEHMYDDEYDDRFNDDVAIPVADNPVGEELQAFNPNRQGRRKESESEDEESEEETNEHSADRNRFNFCEDPAVIRARREARYRTGQAGASGSTSQLKPKGDVVGKPKGQGQDKNTLLNRQKKAANKSSRANHNRKGGAQWKRTRGMVPS